MKTKIYLTIFTIISLSLLFVSSCKPPTETETPKFEVKVIFSGGSTQYNDIYFLDNLTGYLASYNGKVSKTVNSGDSWTDIKNTPGEYYSKVKFTNSNTGFVVGKNSSEGVIYRTTDGGSTWVLIPTLNSQYADYYGVDALSDSIFTIVGGRGSWDQFNGQLLFTSNGGTNWNTTYNEQNVYSVVMRSSSNIFASNILSGILKSTNSGVNWSSALINAGTTLRRIEFTSNLIGYCSGGDGVVGGSGSFYKTTNAGNNWSYIVINPNPSAIYGMSFLNDQVGVITSQSSIYRTIDGGSSFTKEDTNVETILTAIKMFSSNEGIAVGTNGVILKFKFNY